jgi:hypothetical protein
LWPARKSVDTLQLEHSGRWHVVIQILNGLPQLGSEKDGCTKRGLAGRIKNNLKAFRKAAEAFQAIGDFACGHGKHLVPIMGICVRRFSL